MNWTDEHSRSEELASSAEAALRIKDGPRAEIDYREAAKYEEAALDSLNSIGSQPRTRGIIAVSTVSLYYKGRDYGKAQNLANRYLADGTLPEFASSQLRDIMATISTEEYVRGLWTRHHAGRLAKAQEAVHDPDLAEELVADCFIHAWEAVGDASPERKLPRSYSVFREGGALSDFDIKQERAWLDTILKHEIANHWRGVFTQIHGAPRTIVEPGDIRGLSGMVAKMTSAPSSSGSAYSFIWRRLPTALQEKLSGHCQEVSAGLPPPDEAALRADLAKWLNKLIEDPLFYDVNAPERFEGVILSEDLEELIWDIGSRKKHPRLKERNRRLLDSLFATELVPAAKQVRHVRLDENESDAAGGAPTGECSLADMLVAAATDEGDNRRPVIASAFVKDLEGCARSLRPDWLEVYCLVDIQGCDQRKAADQLGVTQGAVTTRLQKARQAVLACLWKKGWSEELRTFDRKWYEVLGGWLRRSWRRFGQDED